MRKMASWESWKPAGIKKLYRHYPQTGESPTATQLASSLDASTKSPDVAKFLNPSSFKLASSVLSLSFATHFASSRDCCFPCLTRLAFLIPFLLSCFNCGVHFVEEMAAMATAAQLGSHLKIASFQGLRAATNGSVLQSGSMHTFFPAPNSRRCLAIKAATSVAPKFTTLKPLGDRVLVKIQTVEEKSAGGILLPTTAQTKPQGIDFFFSLIPPLS